MAAAVETPPENPIDTLVRTFCPVCVEPVLEVVIAQVVYMAEVREWEPRAACSQCAAVMARRRRDALKVPCPRCSAPAGCPCGLDAEEGPKFCRARLDAVTGDRAGHCTRCDGSGYVGTKRPAERMLGVDLAWSDDGYVRLVGPRTKRMRGEGLYSLHSCRVDVSLVPVDP